MTGGNNTPASERCPVCGALVTPGQEVCRRCFEPLVRATPHSNAVTGETCRLYRSSSSQALLVVTPSLLEYDTPELAFQTPWSNVARVSRGIQEDYLRLYQTPAFIRMPLRSARGWFSDRTQSIPLRQFGFPANGDLQADLRRFAPHLRLGA